MTLAELLARVRALLRRSEQDRGAEIRFADTTAGPDYTQGVAEGQGNNLTPKEYSLLEFFMRNPDQLLTRATIADNVWTNSDFDRFTNIVDVYINLPSQENRSRHGQEADPYDTPGRVHHERGMIININRQMSKANQGQKRQSEPQAVPVAC